MAAASTAVAGVVAAGAAVGAVAGWGVAVVPGWGWGGYGWDDGYYGQYPSCSFRRVAVRTAWGVRWRTIQYC